MEGGRWPHFWLLIFLLVGLKEACMSNVSFLGCLEVSVYGWRNNNNNKTENSVELEASVASAEAEVGVLPKADQNT